MITFSHVIRDAEGLHARPVAMIAAACKDIDSAVTVTCSGATVDAEDLLGLMGLCARRGDVLEVAIEGADEESAAEKLRGVFTF